MLPNPFILRNSHKIPFCLVGLLYFLSVLLSFIIGKVTFLCGFFFLLGVFIIILKQGDCLELMKSIADESVDMILCDLPYGTTKNKWDTCIDLEKLWEQYNRVIKENGTICLFADGMFTANLMKSNEKMWRYNFVWDKIRGSDFLNANVKPLKSHEDICIFYKKKPTYNKQYWYSTPYRDTRKERTLSSNYGNNHVVESTSENGERCPLSVLKFKKPNNKGNSHPTQKPVALLEYLIKTYTNEGETVLDNCMGSGSTGVACVNTNRDFIGFELDETYYEIATKRINDALNGGD